MIILDFGSATTCKNDKDYVKRMIDGLIYVDDAREQVVIKWQLFTDIPGAPSLDRDVFLFAKDYAAKFGYETTASVFGADSLAFLLTTSPIFVKISSRENTYELIKDCPVQVIMSVRSVEQHNAFISNPRVRAIMCCVPDYPANPTSYENLFSGLMHYGLSDHTTDWYLYKRFKPKVYECHFKLSDSTGADAGPFSRTPEQLREILS